MSIIASGLGMEDQKHPFIIAGGDGFGSGTSK